MKTFKHLFKYMFVRKGISMSHHRKVCFLVGGIPFRDLRK